MTEESKNKNSTENTGLNLNDLHTILAPMVLAIQDLQEKASAAAADNKKIVDNPKAADPTIEALRRELEEERSYRQKAAIKSGVSEAALNAGLDASAVDYLMAVTAIDSREGVLTVRDRSGLPQTIDKYLEEFQKSAIGSRFKKNPSVEGTNTASSVRRSPASSGGAPSETSADLFARFAAGQL